MPEQRQGPANRAQELADRQVASSPGVYDEPPTLEVCPGCGRPNLGGEYLAHFQARVIQDAIVHATAAFWLHRAQEFEDARPDPARDHNGGPVDYETGASTRPPDLSDLRARWTSLTEVATACRNAAQVAGWAHQTHAGEEVA